MRGAYVLTGCRSGEPSILAGHSLHFLSHPQESNLSNTASLLYHAYHSLSSPSNAVNWAGFYVIDPKSPKQLILGPFNGQVACQTIAIGRGVCGTAVEKKATQLVEDVESFPGHIACDGASKSEIVVPIIQDGKVRLNFLGS